MLAMDQMMTETQLLNPIDLVPGIGFATFLRRGIAYDDLTRRIQSGKADLTFLGEREDSARRVIRYTLLESAYFMYHATIAYVLIDRFGADISQKILNLFH